MFGLSVSIVTQQYFLLMVTSVAFALKSFFLAALVRYGLRSSKMRASLVLLSCVVFSTIVSDVSWIIMLARKLSLISIQYQVGTFFIRISWAFYIVQYHGFALFVESLLKKPLARNILQVILIPVSSCLFLFFVSTAGNSG